MRLDFFPCRALALGLCTLPVLFGSAAKADVYYTTSKTVTTTVSGSAFVGEDTSGKFSNGSGPYNPTIAFNSGAKITGELDIYNSSTVTLATGASIARLVYAHNTSFFTMSGGTIGTVGAGFSDCYAQDTSTITINGGTIVGQLSSIGISTTGHSTVNLNGGSVGYRLYATNNGLVNYSGGTVGDDIYSAQSGTINFIGTNLTATFVGPDGFGDTGYTISGLLADGKTTLSSKNIYVQTGSNAAFTFNGKTPTILGATPAPGSLTIALMGCTGAAIRLARRRRN